ncbi:MAG: asparaginase [Polaromonas sp.]|nr:MAG: asparaginase [Polaromonas sp.]
MTFEPLVEHTRGPLTEIVHAGAAVVVDTTGRVLHSAGDAHAMTFTRSTIKPFQALPFMQGGGAAHFGFAPQHIALLCASHNGEDMHVQGVDEMLKKVGQPFSSLQCGCHVPLRFSYGGLTPPPGATFDERHNNCSGKHTGFLAHCVQHGLPLEDHLAPTHALQKTIRSHVARAARLGEDQLVAGTDGCSAPNYAMPLSRLALSFARLASGRADSEFGESFEALGQAMSAHPEMVSGTGRNDLAFTQAGRGDWLTKIGADGVQVIASKSRRQGMAVKVISGHMPALYNAAVSALDQAGWLDDPQRALLAPWGNQQIINARGRAVGEIRAVFRLESNAVTA